MRSASGVRYFSRFSAYTSIKFLGQEVEKPPVLDDHVTPESRVGELVGLGLQKERHDAFYSVFLINDVLMPPVDACRDSKALFSAQHAFELRTSCFRLSHSFGLPTVLMPGLSSLRRSRVGLGSAAIHRSGHGPAFC